MNAKQVQLANVATNYGSNITINNSYSLKIILYIKVVLIQIILVMQ